MKKATTREELYRLATILAVITVTYNLAEGAVSTWFGFADETLSLFGFGLDSLVEVVSGLGILHMVQKQRLAPSCGRDAFEQQALRITGTGFYVLAVGLIGSSIYQMFVQHAPKTTLWGIIVSSVSILTMWALMQFKVKVGQGLGSEAILTDAACTRVCLYLSAVLLASSLGFHFTGISWFDSVGALAIAWFCYREGKEAFAKSRGETCCSCS